MAGAYKVDITPPPGYPMGGSGFIAQLGRGYWTRLYARAFFFRDRMGQSLAFVSCDLGAMAGGLQAEVARRLRPELNITRENLILAATHTHQGPGNFMSYKLYNDVGSPVKGFNKDLFDMLAERIQAAIECAADDAQEASKTAATELLLKEGTVPDLLRNRAPAPFMLNSDRAAVLQDGPNEPCDPTKPECRCDPNDPFLADCPRFNAVDERISVLEIHRKEGGNDEHVGSMVFLSVHPETLSHETQLYQSDFTGLAMSLLERHDPTHKFVAGFFNGADGDISVRWNHQNRNEVLYFAQYLQKSVEDLTTQKETFKLDSQGSFLVARHDIPANCYFTSLQCVKQHWPWCRPGQKPGSSICLAGEPMYGVATLGGAEDARSPLFDLGWKTGVRKAPWDVQGVKQEAFRASFLPLDLTWMIASPCDYPETIPVSLIRLEGNGNRLNLGILPAELTRTAWWRIEKHWKSIGRILPIGLANEYIGYVATREEYAAQAYEGASTAFGPFTAEVLDAEVGELSGKLHSPVGPGGVTVEKAVFYPGPGVEKAVEPRPEMLGAGHGDPDEAFENLIVDGNGLPMRHWPRFGWNEGAQIDNWKAGERSVEILSTGKFSDDDSGPNILTVYLNPRDIGPHPSIATAYLRASHPTAKNETAYPGVAKKHETKPSASRDWIAIWLAPPTADPKSRFYFRITRQDKTTYCSQYFVLGDVLSGVADPDIPPTPGSPPGQCPP